MGLGGRIHRRFMREWLARMPEDALRARLTSRRGIVFLCYHSIGTELSDYAWRTAPEAFAQHLKILGDLFDILALDDAMERLTANDSDLRPAAVITFDDGFRDNLTQATPILETANLPATLFAPRDLIRRGGATHMTEHELIELSHHKLWSLGAHGVTHNMLPGLVPADQRRELKESRDWLSDLTGIRPRAVAYPQGAICPSSVALARNNYEWGCSTDRRLRTSFDPLQVRRFCPTYAEDDPAAFLRALLTTPAEDGRN